MIRVLLTVHSSRRAGWHQRVLCLGVLYPQLMKADSWVNSPDWHPARAPWGRVVGYNRGWGLMRAKAGAVRLRMASGTGPSPFAGELCPALLLGLVSPWKDVAGRGAIKAVYEGRCFGCTQLKE